MFKVFHQRKPAIISPYENGALHTSNANFIFPYKAKDYAFSN